MKTMPYFLENEGWYETFNDEDGAIGYRLTEAGRANPKVVASFEDFYTPYSDENGDIWDD